MGAELEEEVQPSLYYAQKASLAVHSGGLGAASYPKGWLEATPLRTPSHPDGGGWLLDGAINLT
jgi:hypothetical protein